MIVQNLYIKKKENGISKNKRAKYAKISQTQSSFHRVMKFKDI